MAKGKKAAEAKRDFGRYQVISFQIIGVEDTTAAFSTVNIEATFNAEDESFEEKLKVSMAYQDEKGLLMCRLESGGKWTVVQNSFRNVIYGNT